MAFHLSKRLRDLTRHLGASTLLLAVSGPALAVLASMAGAAAVPMVAPIQSRALAQRTWHDGPIFAKAPELPQSEEALPVLACRLANYGPYQEDAWSHLPSIGIRHVFLNAPPLDQVEAAQRRLAEHGLTAVVLRGDADLSSPTGLDRLEQQLATCKTMGVKFLFLSIKRGEVDKTVIYERLRTGGELARGHGVTIALETHPDLGTNGDVHRETMRQVNHPNVRVNFDTGNIHFYNRGTDAVSELRKIIEFVATVEVKDHNGEFESWTFPALGRGVVDIPAVLKLLKEHHYTGPLTMEIEGIQGVERTREGCLQDIADSAAYLRSLGEFR